MFLCVSFHPLLVFHPFLSSPSLPLISHLPHSVSAGGDRHQTDCQPASAHRTHFSEESQALRFFILQPSLFGLIKLLLRARSRNCLPLCIFFTIHPQTLLIATCTVWVFISLVLCCRITKVKLVAEEKSCAIVVNYKLK